VCNSRNHCQAAACFQWHFSPQSDAYQKQMHASHGKKLQIVQICKKPRLLLLLLLLRLLLRLLLLH
jgi:hypothetical protein